MGTQVVSFIFWHFFLGILFTGELWEFLSFAERYPTIIYNILLFGLTSALGQVSALTGNGLASLRDTGLAGRRVVARLTLMFVKDFRPVADTQELAWSHLSLCISRASYSWRLYILAPWPALSSPQLESSSPSWPLWSSSPTPSAPCSGWALCLCSWVSATQSRHLWATKRQQQNLIFFLPKFTCIFMKFI